VARVGPELVARQEAVLREALKDAVAAAVRAVPVGRRVVLAVDPEAMVPRGPSVRAAPNEPRLVFSAARSSRRGGAVAGDAPRRRAMVSFRRVAVLGATDESGDDPALIGSMDHPSHSAPLPPRPAEAHALAVARDLPGERILCTTHGRAQAGRSLAAERPSADVTVWFLDLFQHDLTRDDIARGESPAAGSARLVCAADMPTGPYDLVVLPTASGGEAELTRDLLQQALVQLRLGGRLVVSTDNPRDRWLHEQLTATGETVRVRPGEETVTYLVEKTREPAKIRDFSCEVVFRDRGRLLKALTRPGVFSHRRIDPGARHLLNAVDVAPDTRVLDIGCGPGSVGLGMAARDPTVHVHAFDSAARAVECARWGATTNGLPNLEVALEAHGSVPEPGTYDLALANPPYYADFRIAALFVESARRGLAPGGTLLVVTKQPSWYLEQLPAEWDSVAREEVKHYHVIEAVRRDGAAEITWGGGRSQPWAPEDEAVE
jgi:16S rRNA G1207 methylase RsmC